MLLCIPVKRNLKQFTLFELLTFPLITPWEKREKTYERLVSLPGILEVSLSVICCIFGVILVLIQGTKYIQRRNLVKGV